MRFFLKNKEQRAKNKLIFVFSLFLVSCFMFHASSVSAYDPNVVETLTNPLGEKEVPALAGSLIKYVLSIVGSIALAMFVYGGVKWMTAAGKAEQVQSAGQIMLWAAAGILMIFASYLVLEFVFRAVK